MFNAQKVLRHVTRSDEAAHLYIGIADKEYYVNDVLVESITMYVCTTKEEGEDDYFDGDLAVNWNMTGLQNNEDARTMGTLMLRNLNSNDEVTDVMQQFYWEHAFDSTLRKILVDAGFSEEAANSVSTSEWGMQDEGRASYDAYDIAVEVRKALNI